MKEVGGLYAGGQRGTLEHLLRLFADRFVARGLDACADGWSWRLCAYGRSWEVDDVPA